MMRQGRNSKNDFEEIQFIVGGGTKLDTSGKCEIWSFLQLVSGIHLKRAQVKRKIYRFIYDLPSVSMGYKSQDLCEYEVLWMPSLSFKRRRSIKSSLGYLYLIQLNAM